MKSKSTGLSTLALLNWVALSCALTLSCNLKRGLMQPEPVAPLPPPPPAAPPSKPEVKAPPPSGEKRALIDVADIKAVIELPKTLRAREGVAIPTGESWFTVLPGKSPVIVTATHATRAMREGNFRFADGGGTAALAVALHNVCDVTAVYTTYDSPSDPNFYDDNAFKAAVAQLIRDSKQTLLLDIHGSHAYRPYDLDIGTMHGASLQEQPELADALAAAFRREGIGNISLDWFAAAKNQTMIKFVNGLAIPSMQLELSILRISPHESDDAAHRFAQTLQAVAEFLGTLDACSRINASPRASDIAD
ncbi:MAG: hypothetical protein QM756_36530 [Polyangiaceae bacterium]